MSVYIGDVQTFAGVIADKPQVLKIGEEAMEVFSAWETWKTLAASNPRRADVVNECADVIQAACNLLAALGVDDMRQPMQECYVRNKERGREYANDVLSAENDVSLQDVEANDSREKLEADIYEYCDYHSDELETAKAWLDRQAAITERECKERVNFSMITQTANAMFPDYQKRIAELQAENEAMKARVETLRSKLSKMLDAASEIQHIGDLP